MVKIYQRAPSFLDRDLWINAINFEDEKIGHGSKVYPFKPSAKQTTTQNKFFAATTNILFKGEWIGSKIDNDAANNQPNFNPPLNSPEQDCLESLSLSSQKEKMDIEVIFNPNRALKVGSEC